MNDAVLDKDPGFKIIELLLMTFAALLLVTSLYLLVSGVSLRRWLLGWQDTIEMEAVGEVVEESGDFKRKKNDDLEFFDAKNKDVLYNYDTILTQDDSKATLRLRDGSVITLGPRTMIRITYEELVGLDGIKKTSGFDLLSGNIKIDKLNSDLNILNDSKRVNLAGATELQGPKPGVERSLGKALPELNLIKNKLSTTAAVNQAKLRIFSPNNNVLFSPPPQVGRPKQVITFNWEQNPPDSPTQIEIYFHGSNLSTSTEDGAEKKLVITKNIESGVPNRKFNVAFDRPGFYTWTIRIPDITGESLIAASYTFQINRFVEMIELERPQQLGKNDISNVFTGQHLDNPEMSFRWKPIESVDRYVVRVFRDPQGKNLIYEKEISGNARELRNDNLIKNKLYYQVQAQLENGFVATSRMGSVGFDFLPPVLAFPKDKSKFNTALLKKEKDQILFTWRKTNYTESYAVEISKSPRFDQIVYKAIPKTNFMVFKTKLNPGTYYWRVSSVGKKIKSEPSAPASFTVQ